MSQTEPEPGQIGDDDFNERLRRNQRIQDTAQTEGWNEIVEFANEKRSALQHRLAFGSCTDWDDYQRTYAEFQGISFVLDIPKTAGQHVEALRKMRDEDREGASE